MVGEKIANFQLKRVRSGVETLLSKAKLDKAVRAHIQSHGISRVQARHVDGNDFMVEMQAALELLLRLIERRR